MEIQQFPEWTLQNSYCFEDWLQQYLHELDRQKIFLLAFSIFKRLGQLYLVKTKDKLECLTESEFKNMYCKYVLILYANSINNNYTIVDLLQDPYYYNLVNFRKLIFNPN